MGIVMIETFGIIFGIIGLIGYIAGKAIQEVDSYNKRHSAQQDGKTEYYDHFGVRRDVASGEPLYYREVDGERVLVDHSGKIYRSITSEQIHDRLQKKLSDPDFNGSVIFVDYKGRELRPGLYGRVEYVMDIETKELLAAIEISEIYFPQEIRNILREKHKYAKENNIIAYMREDGTFIRMSDLNIECYKEYENFNDKVINYLNELQQNYIKKYNRIAYNQVELGKGRRK